jgi:hypothetical protein
MRVAKEMHSEKDVQRFVIHQRTLMMPAKRTPWWAIRNWPGAKTSHALLCAPIPEANELMAEPEADFSFADFFTD